MEELLAFLGVGGGEFGKELDSLCDLGSFGVAPAILIYQYGMTDLGLLGKISLLPFLQFVVLCV